MAIKYLSGKRLQGTAAERTALNITSPPATSWKELARASLSGAGDTITTSTFTPKDNMKVLTFGLASGNIEASLQVGNGSIDTGSNYSVRWQVNGTEGTGTSKTSIDTNHTATGNEFITYDISNVANQEKLVIADLVDSNSAGAGNVPNRVEHVGKWANTSNQINIVQAKNVGGGSFDTGSEIVVLGYDNDEADSGTNFWQELGSTELTGAGDDVTVSFTAKKYLMVEAYMVGGSGNNFRNAWKLNGVSSGSTYAYRKSSNGGSDNTYTSRNLLEIGDQDQEHDSYQKLFIVNKDGKEKLGIMHAVREENNSTSDPSRTEAAFKWTTTSGQITSITAHNDQTGNFGIGSYVKVWGSD